MGGKYYFSCIANFDQSCKQILAQTLKRENCPNVKHLKYKPHESESIEAKIWENKISITFET